MIAYHLKDSLHWLHLFCFKGRTFAHLTTGLSLGQSFRIFIRLYLWLFVFGLIFLVAMELFYYGKRNAEMGFPNEQIKSTEESKAEELKIEIEVDKVLKRYDSDWEPPLLEMIKRGFLFGLISGLTVWVLVIPISSNVSLGLAVTIGLGASLSGGLSIWLGNARSAGIVTGLIGGLIGAIFNSLTIKIGRAVLAGLFSGLVAGALLWLNIDQREYGAFSLRYFPLFAATFVLVTGRLYYWPFHFYQLSFAKISDNPLLPLRNSPVHWDETICAPLPWLSNWLFVIAQSDRQAGVAEVLWVAAERPFQRKAAQQALLKLAVADLTQFRSITDLRNAATVIDFLPDEESALLLEDGAPLLAEDGQRLVTESSGLGPVGISQARPHLSKISEIAADYLKRQTPIGQHKALTELQQAVNRFAKAMALAPAPTGPEMQRVATQWLQFINAAETELRARLPFGNPFRAGNPLLEHEDDLFKGRRDLIVKLEEAIFTNRPTLLLYGRRRTGKSSTLLNLPRLMSSQFVPVFIDCQNARWNDSDAMFCYHLTRALHDELAKRKLPLRQEDGLAQPNKSEFAQHPFTRLDEFLDELEAHSRRIGRQILLTFDEYEKLEEGLRDGKVTRAVLNQIRAIVQHRERLIVLFSGSHRFDELHAVNWSDYLINVQTLHLSFLARDEARELIEHPTPEFALGYAPGVVDRILDLTHGQPYLVQALGFELVNHINRDKRKEATATDLETAIGRVLESAEGYFENTWRDCTENEQAVLCALAAHQPDGLTATERAVALQGLQRKELVEQRDGQWHYLVELIRLWVVKNRVVPLVLEAELQAA